MMLNFSSRKEQDMIERYDDELGPRLETEIEWRHKEQLKYKGKSYICNDSTVGVSLCFPLS